MLMPKHQDFTAVYELNSGLLCFEVALRCFPHEVNANTSICGVFPLVQCHGWEAFMHLADAFIQSDLQCIQVMHEKVVLILGQFLDLRPSCFKMCLSSSMFVKSPSCLDVHASIRLGPVSIDTRANT